VRVAVVSDVHANLAALEAVLAAIDAATVDELWCLGDLIGYGPRPNECVDVIRGRAAICLAGNHDLGVLGDLSLEEFSDDAAAAARWTRDVLGTEQRAWLRKLSPVGEREGVQLFHASIQDPIWEYVVTEKTALDCLVKQRTDLALIGHSHVALALQLSKGRIKGGTAPAGHEYDLNERKCLLNPGSVGQPRDRDPRAAWLLLDLAARHATFRREPYDVERTQREIREAGLPARLADRLPLGF
jgi:diadenosine tetraphosphatase ApaH/serine/threonine PP2A family protein phosphatase